MGVAPEKIWPSRYS
ncbi:hypothetical protein P0942_02470 [Salmonella enterica subsp. enterica serovar Newport]|nr:MULTISPECIES: hypothetical protein [Salmonella]MCT6975419.1 helix-turn-helix domain-containing protein [Salmonella enterica subsp. enterica serovar Yoruba]MCT7062979.1 helix-turn-helix domain-containing protein [Salmonella enterica subsp. enterica serovar Soahanina]MCV2454748.1 helix-turn-helix domain-containing protein [Salmonella enterica subsp. enterica serovar Abortusequi]MCY5398532.1 hypothetical protein [Salmonella enterica subsp. enterica serovar 1,4,[5],12:i:-]MCZ0767139.1 hypotheti